MVNVDRKNFRLQNFACNNTGVNKNVKTVCIYDGAELKVVKVVLRPAKKYFNQII